MIRLHYLLSVLFAGMIIQGKAQPPKETVTVPANLKGFIPKGYEALDLTKGDLNRDAYPDAILVLYKTGEEQTSNVSEHPAAIAGACGTIKPYI